MEVYDLVGIGFGPSNIALAIALKEKHENDRDFRALFLERQPSFAWHKHMMLDDTRMQVAFLKDLVSLRNPMSRFSFINYLHQKRRLQDFINLKTFYPSRHEFADYLAWAASHFDETCKYGQEVMSVTPHVRGDRVDLVDIQARDSDGTPHRYQARNLVVSVGGSAYFPECFKPLRNDPRIFHSSTYLKDISDHPRARRIAVIGAGQSAAEIFMDLQNHPGSPQVDLIIRGSALKVSDDSPFSNEIFNPQLVDLLYDNPDMNAQLLKEYWHTNYAAANPDLVERIFDVFYQQKVKERHRHRMLRFHEVADVHASERAVHLTFTDKINGNEVTHAYDAVILATGYVRDRHRALLTSLRPYLDDFSVDRHYRLVSTADFEPGIFLQGACEDSHGISDTLLSILAIRAAEICDALVHTSNPARDVWPTTL